MFPVSKTSADMRSRAEASTCDWEGAAGALAILPAAENCVNQGLL